MAVQMIVRVDPATKQKLGHLARTEGKTTSQLIRDALDEYLRDHDPETHIEDLWARIRQSIETRGNGPQNVERIVSEV
ncbi:MAG: CopG family transcriptional regulator, partial [Proteobacteria bacterium]|nr:CopG family transcriptional regulator [Pseudomonadota bacterium]